MSVVFTDTYTVLVDSALESYPLTPDYSSLLNGNNLIVNAANDRVQVEVSGSDVVYRCLNTACPTGDYKASLDVGVRTGYDGGYVAVRCHASTADCYVLLRTSSTLWELYRLDGGTFVLLTSYSVSTTDNSTQAIACKVTGTNPVALTPTLAGSDRTVFNDSNANRKQSGRWGGAVYDSAANAASWFDNASIDDLAAGGNATLNGTTITATASIATAGALQSAGSINGTTLTATASIATAGALSASASIAGQTLAATASIASAGVMEAGSTIPGQTLTALASIAAAGTLSGTGDAQISGQTLVSTAVILAGGFEFGSTLAGQTLTVTASIASAGALSVPGAGGAGQSGPLAISIAISL